jgi:hypothetical protein
MANLDINEQKILKMCIKATIDKDYHDINFQQDLHRIQNYEFILKQLSPLFINLIDGKDTQFDYTKNGYIISDYTIKKYNVKL